MKAVKFFNFSMPYDTYTELKRMSFENDHAISNYIREGIDLVIKEAKKGKISKTKKR